MTFWDFLHISSGCTPTLAVKVTRAHTACNHTQHVTSVNRIEVIYDGSGKCGAGLSKQIGQSKWCFRKELAAWRSGAHCAAWRSGAHCAADHVAIVIVGFTCFWYSWSRKNFQISISAEPPGIVQEMCCITIRVTNSFLKSGHISMDIVQSRCRPVCPTPCTIRTICSPACPTHHTPCTFPCCLPCTFPWVTCPSHTPHTLYNHTTVHFHG